MGNTGKKEKLENKTELSTWKVYSQNSESELWTLSDHYTNDTNLLLIQLNFQLSNCNRTFSIFFFKVANYLIKMF